MYYHKQDNMIDKKKAQYDDDQASHSVWRREGISK